MADWGSIYLAGAVGASEPAAAFGYATYALAMTAGRFAGDRLVAALGPSALLRASGLCVAAGLIAAVAVRTYPATLAGFAFAGLGLANAIPILFRSAGRGATPAGPSPPSRPSATSGSWPARRSSGRSPGLQACRMRPSSSCCSA